MDSIYKTYKPAGGGDGLFLRLTDGDSVKLRVASEPAIYEQEFKDPDTGEVKLTTKFAWVVWNRDEGKAQVLSQGKMVYNQLADLVDEWGEPTQFDCTVKRTGQKLETRYVVNPLPKSTDLTKDEQEECDKIDLLKAVKGHWLKDYEDGGTPLPDPKDKVYDVDDDKVIGKDDLNDLFPE